MKNRYIGILFFTISLIPVSLLSQNNEIGNWIMYFGTNKISEKISIHTEFQYRNHTLGISNTEQLLPRIGLNYHFSKKAIVTAGYAYIPSYIFDSEQSSPEIEEHRIWEQFILTNKIGRVKFEHRYRLEQRFVNKKFKNRFRYRIMLFIPLNKPKIEKGSVFLGVYDEVFINAKETFFDRNRLYGGLGYQLNKNVNIQTGLLHQQLNRFGKFYLQFAMVFNTDLRKNKK